MEKILIVNVNWLGDVLFSSAVFQTIKNKRSDVWLSCLAHPRVKEILEMIPGLDEIIIYDEDQKHATSLSKWRLISHLRNQKFDRVYLLHRSLTRALLVFLAGIPRRIGYATKNRGFLLTEALKVTPNAKHRMDYYLGVIEKDFPMPVKTCRLNVGPEQKEYTVKLLQNLNISPSDKKVCIHPAGNWNLKRWPKEYFIRCIEAFQKRGIKVILIGTTKDRALIDQIKKQLKEEPIDLLGKTSIKQLAALMQICDCVISGDSGPLHIANSVGVKTIALYGPTSVGVTGPRGLALSSILRQNVGCNEKPCYHLACPDNICMKSISVLDVLDAFEQIKN